MTVMEQKHIIFFAFVILHLAYVSVLPKNSTFYIEQKGKKLNEV